MHVFLRRGKSNGAIVGQVLIVEHAVISVLLGRMNPVTMFAQRYNSIRLFPGQGYVCWVPMLLLLTIIPRDIGSGGQVLNVARGATVVIFLENVLRHR